MMNSNAICFNTMTPRLNIRHFTDIVELTFFHEICFILIKMPLNFVSKEPKNNRTALVEIMCSYRTDEKPLSEPIMASSTGAHLCHSATLNSPVFFLHWPASPQKPIIRSFFVYPSLQRSTFSESRYFSCNIRAIK